MWMAGDDLRFLTAVGGIEVVGLAFADDLRSEVFAIPLPFRASLTPISCHYCADKTCHIPVSTPSGTPSGFLPPCGALHQSKRISNEMPLWDNQLGRYSPPSLAVISHGPLPWSNQIR